MYTYVPTNDGVGLDDELRTSPPAVHPLWLPAGRPLVNTDDWNDAPSTRVTPVTLPTMLHHHLGHILHILHMCFTLPWCPGSRVLTWQSIETGQAGGAG